ncbi:hypothetical protein GCM10017602_14040 [Herbiconiux flava]|nr:hypothetical protein GCM10017602_14040 [Herbiconiux flava]
MELMTAGAAASLLNVSLRALDHLGKAGLLPPPQQVGRQKLYDANSVELLAALPFVPKPYPPAYVVRVLSKAATLEPDRMFTGYSRGPYDPDLSAAQNATVRADALRGWWPCKNPLDQVGRPLVATLGGFVVEVYDIRDASDQRNGRVRFGVRPPTSEQVEAFSGRRLKLTSGPVSLPIGPESQ